MLILENLAAMSYVHNRKLSYLGLPSGQGEGQSEGEGDRSEGLRGQS